MSIYRVQKVFLETDVTAPLKAKPTAAKPTPARTPLKSVDSISPWAHLRNSNPLNKVLPQSQRWADELPDEVRPVHLLEQFPRIVNVIALEWNRPTTIGKQFDDLLHDRRGTRRGFPAEVRKELLALRDHYYFGVLVKKQSVAQ